MFPDWGVIRRGVQTMHSLPVFFCEAVRMGGLPVRCGNESVWRSQSGKR